MDQLDSRILCAAQKGDTEAFDAVVTHYLPLVYGYLTRFVRDAVVAEDLTQETFIRVWKNIRSFDTDKPFKPWLMRIARNCALDLLRRKQTAAFSSLSAAEYAQIEFMVDTAATPSQQAQVAETANTIAHALAILKPTEKEVLTLHYIDELSTSEIAEVLSLPYETVRTRLRRARAAFRDICEPDVVPSFVLDNKGTYDSEKSQTITQLSPNPSSP